MSFFNESPGSFQGRLNLVVCAGLHPFLRIPLLGSGVDGSLCLSIFFKLLGVSANKLNGWWSKLPE
jgi:hypothetical protein